MVHLRVVAPAEKTDRVHGLLCATRSAINVIRVPGASTNPTGDLIMCDVAREDASVIISELRDLGLHHEGSIALSATDVVSDFAVAAEKYAPGLARRRGDLGGARPAHERERRAQRPSS